MRSLLILVMFGLLQFSAAGQTYTDSIAIHRQHYKQEFITEERSPLKGNDTSYLRFFAADAQYRVMATFRATPDAKPFDLPTYSGKVKQFRQYGVLEFRIHDTSLSLQVYQNLKLLDDPKYKDHLFVPFTDLTTYVETYGGGRYIDLSTADIHNNTILLDFNKCYNPYCAYATGYNCPIPPVENRLPVAIHAGEMLFGKEH